MTDVTERFLRYVKIDTQSEEGYESTPSTLKQFDLARVLRDELTETGATDVYLDEKLCYVYARVPSNIGENAARLGFVAHMDTSTAVSGADVHPIITENYDGGDIAMGGEYVLSPKQFPALLNHIGETIISTDGTTLLGGDDKAGIAEIMGLVKFLVENPDFKHGDISICFTPDEEVGMGVWGFDYDRFNADFAYTVDGGELGEINYECFNAAAGKVYVIGTSIHPGSAKNQMVNALRVAMEFDSLLPAAQRPEHTEGYEGFFHLDEFSGNVDAAKLDYIIRDHDREIFEKRKKLFADAADFINKKYGEGTLRADIIDGYRNMAEIVRENYHLVENACAAFRDFGIEPKIDPIRGGTDGANLSYNGLPCPNLATGGFNCHGRFEFVPAESMDKMVEVLKKLVTTYSEYVK